MLMKAVSILKPGGPDMLKIVQMPIPSPSPNEVLIKVHSTAINRADILQRKGLYPVPKGTTEVLGLECSGIVHKGNGWMTEGTPVMGFLRGGGYAEYVTVHKDQVMTIPHGMNFVDAAAIPEVWLTAYKCLRYIGKGKKGESVLVHAGASGVGSALIQLGKFFGLEVLATCGTDEKVEYCKQLGADFVWNYKNGDFFQGFAGKDVDLIMDSVGKNYFDSNVEIIKKEGRWVVYGFLSGSRIEADLMKVFGKLASISFTSFRSRSDEFRADVIRKFLEDRILDGFCSGIFNPCVFKVISLDDIKDGHESMQKNENSGKIVVKIGEF